MNTSGYEIILPESGEQLDQNEEWFMVKHEGQVKKVRSHDYDEIYKIPGLYEDIFYKRLGCISPKVVCELLDGEMKKKNESGLRVFDFGAGNGIVGEIIRDMACDLLIGVDILPEAKEAAERDRPGIYDDYYVLDMASLGDEEKRKFEAYDFNALVTVAALGFDDIPTMAFMNAFNLLKNDAWVAFNIKENFLSEVDSSGYSEVISKIMDDSLVVLQERKYCHRLSVAGEELCYRAIVGKKANNIDDISGIIR